jgi:hypothetical protein
MRRSYWIMLGVIGLAVVVAGSAVAATKLESPSEQSKAIINDAAGRLHVAPSALSSALKQALDDQIDAAVKAGRLTKRQASELEARVDKGQMPLVGGLGYRFAGHGFGFGGHGFGFGGHGFGFGGHGFGRRGGMFGAGLGGGMIGAGSKTVTSYLGVTQAQLHGALASGKSLAQIAKAHGKTPDGLVAALVATAKSRLDKAVSAKHLTSAQETAILGRMQTFFKTLVNRTPHAWSEKVPHHAAGFGFGSQHRFWTPSARTHPSLRSSALTAPQL